jgi:hypothetical protein
MPSSPTLGNTESTEAGVRGASALDRLLAVLKTPALAADLAARTELWPEIKRLAEIHRFSGMLAHESSPWLPSSERPWRDQTLMLHHQRHALRLAALRRLTEAFQNEGLACVSLKGPLLAERFYAQPFLRPSNDLDLLIYERDAGASVRLMRKLGFQIAGSYPWHLQRRLVQHFNFQPTDGSPRVEMHYRLLAGASYLGGAEFMDRSVIWRSPSGFESGVMSPADEAFYSTVHAANHAFHRLRWLYDTIAIARGLTAEDGAQIRELAIRLGQSGQFTAARLAAQEFFGESLELGCRGLPIPWLWGRLAPRHVRRMVERVEGNTATFAEKFGYRLDLCRMAGSPLKAAQVIAFGMDLEIRKRWYTLRNPPDPDILSKTLPPDVPR